MGKKTLWFGTTAAALAGAVALASSPAAAHTSVGIQFGAPAPVYVAPQPVYGPAYGRVWVPGHWEWQGHRHAWVPGYYTRPHHAGWQRDRDRDGIPNRYDRDRDGDGVPNRYDRAPDSRYRY